MLFEGRTGITCPRECVIRFPTPPSLHYGCQHEGVEWPPFVPGQPWCFTAIPARNKRQFHINVLELGVIRLTSLSLEEEVLSQTS